MGEKISALSSRIQKIVSDLDRKANYGEALDVKFSTMQTEFQQMNRKISRNHTD
jgi:hypothetical protein